MVTTTINSNGFVGRTTVVDEMPRILPDVFLYGMFLFADCCCVDQLLNYF